MFCPHCLFRENYRQRVQIDRPCPRCTYCGDWFGTAVFSWIPELTLPQEARVAAAYLVADILCEQERSRETMN